MIDRPADRNLEALDRGPERPVGGRPAAIPRPARMALPAPGGPPFEGLMRRKEMTMTELTTTMTELREIDLDELACVDGGVDVDLPGERPPCGFPPPYLHPGQPS
jgi:hypothetical protein